MEFVNRTLRWQRVALGALLVGSAVGFWRSTYDVFNTFKATVIVAGALLIAAASAVRVSRTRRLLLPATPAWYPIGAFCLALVVATAASDRPLLSIVGRPGRHTGLALYLVYVFLFGAVLRLYRDRSPAELAKVLMAAAAPVAAYGLLQATGVEPLGWETVEGGPPVFSTFGNANFLAAYLGIVFPLCLWGALTLSWSVAARVASILVGALALAAAVATTSLQGVAAAAVGTAVVTTVWLWT
ncbi:MAG: hypothetical protein M3N52_11550, partial [Actinomycetota bacterium]|nr:hypothetical protein [Actinomycetota bacterium]